MGVPCPHHRQQSCDRRRWLRDQSRSRLWTEGAMLKRLGEHITACYERAQQSDERAVQTDDPQHKAEHSEMAARWRYLAQSFAFVESLERFLLDSQKAKDARLP